MKQEKKSFLGNRLKMWEITFFLKGSLMSSSEEIIFFIYIFLHFITRRRKMILFCMDKKNLYFSSNYQNEFIKFYSSLISRVIAIASQNKYWFDVLMRIWKISHYFSENEFQFWKWKEGGCDWPRIWKRVDKVFHALHHS